MTAPASTAVLLTQFLAAHRAPAFSWATANCCHFAAAWVLHATGRDPMQGLASTPSARAALRLVRSLGGSLQAAWTRQLGRPPVPAAMAQVGDLVLMPTHAQPWLGEVGTGALVGICVGPSVVVAGDLGGYLYAPLCGGTVAWRLRDEGVA